MYLADFFIKRYFQYNFAYESIPLIKNILHFTVVFNSGAAFGIFKNHPYFLLAVAILFIVFLVYFITQKKGFALSEYIFFGLILGGALSNLWDRLVFGYVIDYIDIRIWPVFNLSDSCITVGAVGLIVKSLRKPCARK